MYKFTHYRRGIWREHCLCWQCKESYTSRDLLLGLQKRAVVTTFLKSAPSISLYAHYQYPILHNREFRSLGNRKNYIKSTKATLQGNDVRVYLCLHCTIIFAIFDFLSEFFFHIFFMYI
jgi:hypothetical protein